jgi:hypothetical protein
MENIVSPPTRIQTLSCIPQAAATSCEKKSPGIFAGASLLHEVKLYAL